MIDLSKLDLDSPEPPVERIEVAAPLKLATSRYQSWRPELGYLPIGITVGRYRAARYSYLSIGHLAPHELYLPRFKNIDNIPIERRVYRERLRVLEGEILAALQEVAQAHPDTPGVLLCFEDVNGKDGPNGCHRRWFAQYADERWGWDVPELPNPAWVAPAQPRKPKPPAPPTLF
ncbi:hypothetical protein ABTX34_17185 [Streptomyces sp. NPDC096538]|uniref:hypothetical protein n=1 Tax=Streptomyces sp. NPDC096538 TaxID=3155427 RepID=UPI00332166AE